MAAAPRKERAMGVSVGLIELRHIPLGYETVDAMLKAADVELVRASPSCPGKFLAIVTGGVGAVECACAAAERSAGRQAVVCRAIDHLDEAVAGFSGRGLVRLCDGIAGRGADSLGGRSNAPRPRS